MSDEKLQEDSLMLQKLLGKHLTPGLQALEDEGIEVVIVGGRRPTLDGEGTVGIAGTVHTPEHAFLLLVSAVREMKPGIEIKLPADTGQE